MSAEKKRPIFFPLSLACAVALTACARPDNVSASKPTDVATQADQGTIACSACAPSTPCGTSCTRLNGDVSACGLSASLCTPAQGPTNGLGVNWALAQNGGYAYSASTRAGYSPAVVNDGDRSGARGYWAGSNFPASNCNYVDGNYQYVRINFNGNHPINEIDIFQLQDGAATRPPTPAMTFTMYGLSVYRLQYCPADVVCTDGLSGTGWVEPRGGYVYAAQQNGADHVWNKLTFPPASASAVRVLIECGSAPVPYLVELEAWDTSAVGVNVAAAANGSTAQATSSYSSAFPASAAIDGDRSAWNWGSPAQGGGWIDSTSDTYPDVLAVTFPGPKNISEIDLFGIQDAYTSPSVPTLTQTWTRYGLSNFQVQYCPTGTSCSDYSAVPGTGWIDVPGSPVTNNTYVWRQFVFAPVSATQIRVVVTAAGSGYSRIAELEAWDFSGATGTLSPDPRTAIELRRQMMGESCGSMSTASLRGVPGYYEKCSYNFITWSAPTGAWSFATPSYISTRYLGGFNRSAFPSPPTSEMNNLGWTTGPYVGRDLEGSYVEFQWGIMAAPAAIAAPKVIGGIVSGRPLFDRPDKSKIVNTLLATAWLSATFPNKYPATDTVPYSLGITAPPQSTCGPSDYGNRGFYFTTRPNSSGYRTTFTVKEGASHSYVIGGANQALWENTLNYDCPTLTKLGWPVSNEQPYIVNGISATHQEFEGGTIKFEPSNCTGPNTSQIVLQQSPTHVLAASMMTCDPAPIAFACTNSQEQISNDGSYTYYWHCPGISTSGPGASTVSTSPNSWFSGLTIAAKASGCTYVIDDPTYNVWLNAGSDGTVEGAIAQNAPPTTRSDSGCSAWEYDTSGSDAGSVPFAFSFCASGNCENDTPVRFYLQYTTTSGYVSDWINVLTQPAGTYPNPGRGARQNVPGVFNAKNCVYATFGDPLYTTPISCQYLHADTVQRKPARLTLTVGVNANGGATNWPFPVFVRLQDKTGLDSTVAAPYDNYSWLDLPGHPFQSGRTYSFDLNIDHLNDIDDITQILLGSTGNALCIDSLGLLVDDDGVLNNGGDQSRTGPGSAYRVVYYKNYLNELGHCATTANVDFNNYNAPGTALVKVDFNSLRNSPDWQYQHTYWTDVHSRYGGGTQASHFSGYPNKNSLKALIYEEFQTALHDNGYHFTADRTIEVAGWDSKNLGAGYVVPVFAPEAAVHDVLHANVYFEGSFNYRASFDMQLVTHCDSGHTIKSTDVIPLNVKVHVTNWWATTPLTGLLPWIVGLVAEHVGSGTISRHLKSVNLPAVIGAIPFRYTWAPELNGAGGATDSTHWPGFGLEVGWASGSARPNLYCTYIDQ